MKLPSSGNRLHDPYDIAYYRLEASFVAKLSSAFIFLAHDDVDLFDISSTGDAYTMIGYPARKARIKGRIISSDIFTLTGEAREKSFYIKHGYNVEHHLLLRFRNKKSFHFIHKRRMVAPNPEGMSGGGVFAWIKELGKNANIPPSPTLVGIIMMYHPSEGTYIATRLNCFIRCILKNNPNLPIGNAGYFSHEGKM